MAAARNEADGVEVIDEVKEVDDDSDREAAEDEDERVAEGTIR
jgi:hypothetical protein